MKHHPFEVAARVAAGIFTGIARGDQMPQSTRLLDEAISTAGLEGARASRAFDITMAILRWRDRLDAEIERTLTRRKLDVPEYQRNLMRAAAYELMVRREDEPAGLVNEIVNLVKAAGGATDARGATDTRGAGEARARFANAVLRKLAALEPLPAPEDSAGIDKFAKFYSLPSLFLEKIVAEHGADAARAIARATVDRIAHHLRVNPFAEPNEAYPSELGARKTAHRDELIWECDALTSKIRAANDDGRIIVQALPSQVASLVLDPRPGDRVLDAASGVGVKAHHLLSLIAGWGELTLCDTSSSKRNVCLTNFKRWSAPEPDYRIVDLADADAVASEFKGATFNAILLDAPCSGSGLIHHMPEKRYTTDLGKLHEFGDLQKRMLQNLLKLLAPEGSLVYATCSIWRGENEDVTEAALAESKEFESVERLSFMPCGAHPGFFIEKLRRMS